MRKQETRLQSSSMRRMKNLGKFKPDYRFGFPRRASASQGFRQVLAFKKFWPAILIVAILFIGFSFPLIFSNISMSNNEDLFDLTFDLFNLFWLLGWSMGVLIIASVLVLLLFAREVLIVDRQGIRLRIEVLQFGVEVINPLERLSNLKIAQGEPGTGNSWRGQHVQFDYLGIPIGLGCNLSSEQASQLIRDINSALAHPIPATLDLTPEQLAAMAAEKAQVEAERAAEAEQQAAIVRATAEEVSKSAEPIDYSSPSTLLLIVANLIPVGGVILLNWNIGEIMLLFWIESAIVGFYNILKLFRISGWSAIFTSIFFTAHYGGFMAVHLLFIFTFFITSPNGPSPDLADVASIFANLWLAILALFISHGFSFWKNFLGNQEYLKSSTQKQMGEPYKRIIMMHLTIIFGGFLVMALGAPLIALLLLIVMKMMVDLKSHVREHAGDNQTAS